MASYPPGPAAASEPVGSLPVAEGGESFAPAATTLGDHNSPPYQRAVQKVLEYERQYRQDLTPYFQSSIRDWKDWMGERTDKRGPHEKWRANVHVPYPNSTVETELAALVDILMSPDPLIEPEALRVKDESRARGLTSAYDYWVRANQFRRFLTTSLRSAIIQGVEGYKLVWENDTSYMPYMPTQEEKTNFGQALMMAKQFGFPPSPNWEQDPNGFAQWRMETNAAALQAGIPLAIPDPPLQLLEITRYRGPRLIRVPIYEMRFDVRTEDTQKQYCMIHRMVKSADWVLRKAEEGVFVKSEVERAIRNTTGEKFSEWENQIAQMLNLPATPVDSTSQYRDACEILEFFCPDDPEAKHVVLLNQHAIINPDPTTMPYWHAQHCLGLLRDTIVPGHAPGLPSMRQVRPLYEEMDTLRSLRIDALTLAVLPILLKQSGMGPVEMSQFLRPGLIIPVPSISNSIAPMSKPQIPDAVFREQAEIKADIDDYRSTYQNVKGAPATVGRVSATDTERRYTQALSRVKLRVGGYEDDLSAMVPQMAALQYQKGGDELAVRLAGDDENPWTSLSRGDFLEALNMDFRLRGATKALNKDALIQQITTIVEKFMGVLSPIEIRAAGLRVYETANLKGKEQVFVPENGELLDGVWQATQEATMLQAQLQAFQLKDMVKMYQQKEQLELQIQQLTEQVQQAGNTPEGQQAAAQIVQLQAQLQQIQAALAPPAPAEGGGGGGGSKEAK